MTEPRYWVMDGRARHSVDDAIIITVARTIEEARRDVKEHAGDACIVDAVTQEWLPELDLPDD